MVTNTELKQLNLAEAAQLRQQAGALLDRLTADRQQSERRSADSGKRDPMKFVTGQTALDAAIASTRDIVEQMDCLLASLQQDARDTGALLPRRQRPVLRTIGKARSASTPAPLPAPVAATP